MYLKVFRLQSAFYTADYSLSQLLDLGSKYVTLHGKTYTNAYPLNRWK